MNTTALQPQAEAESAVAKDVADLAGGEAGTGASEQKPKSASSEFAHGYHAPMELMPPSPSLVGVEEFSKSLLKTQQGLARMRLQALLGRAGGTVVSHERARSGKDAGDMSIEDVALGMLGFGPAFCWNDAEVIWEIEKSKLFARKSRKAELMGDSTITTHLARADQFYRDGNIEKAMEGYQHVEGQTKRSDFTLLITQGNLRLFRLGQPGSAQQYYLRAARQLQDKHLYFAAYALLHQALCSYHLGGMDQASKLAGRAVSLMPDFVEARYQLAQYEMLAERPNSALKELTKALADDRRYVLKALIDPTFRDLHGALLGHLEEHVESLIESTHPLRDLAGAMLERLETPCVVNGDAALLQHELRGHVRYLDDGLKNRGFLDVHALLHDTRGRFLEFAESIKAYAAEADQKMDEARTRLRRKKEKLRDSSIGKQRVAAGVALLLGFGVAGAILMEASDPQSMLLAVGVALGTVIIGGLVGVAIPALAARDDETRKLAEGIDALSCQRDALDQVAALLETQIKPDDDVSWRR